MKMPLFPFFLSCKKPQNGLYKVSSSRPTPLCYYLSKGGIHLQLKVSDSAFLISELKKPYMNGFSALLQYKRMMEECLIRPGTGEIESVKRITTNGVQEIRKVHVTMRNVLNILISRFSRAL